MMSKNFTVPSLWGIPRGMTPIDCELHRQEEKSRLKERPHTYPSRPKVVRKDPYAGVPRLKYWPEEAGFQKWFKGVRLIAEKNESTVSNGRVRSLSRNRIDKNSGRWIRRVPQERSRARWVHPQEVKKVYAKGRTLSSLVNHFQIKPEFAKSVLEAYGFGFLDEIASDFVNGMTLRDLAEKHCVTEEKVSGWLKSHGVSVTRGRRRPLRDKQAMLRLYAATGSINRVRHEFDLSWATARKILLEEGAEL